METLSEEIIQKVLSKNAYHSTDLINHSYDGTLYFKLTARKDLYKKVNLIVFVNDMPIVISGYRLFWNGELDYFIIKCENNVPHGGILYYFELTRSDGTLEYLGKNNDVTTEEWKIESFEYKPEDLIERKEVKNFDVDSLFILMDKFKTSELSILNELEIKNLLFEKDDFKKIEGFSCKSMKNLNELLPFSDTKSNSFVIDRDFNTVCRDFFLSKNLDATKLVEILGNNLFSFPIDLNYFNLRYLNLNFDIKNELLPYYKLATALQFIFMGIPLIPFSVLKSMTPDLTAHIKNLIDVRRSNAVLRKGELRFIFSNSDIFGFERFSNEDRLLIFFNRSDESFVMDITKYFGNGDFIDISKEHPLKRKRQYSLYPQDFVILKKIRDR